MTGEFDASTSRAAQLAAERELEPIQQHYREVGWEAAIGASGTIRTVESIVRDQQWSDHGITADALEKLKETLIEAGDVERLSILNEQSPRAAVFPGGVAILVATFKALGIKRMTTSDNALREGVLYDLLGRHGDEDVREVTIRNLSSGIVSILSKRHGWRRPPFICRARLKRAGVSAKRNTGIF